MHLLSLWRSVLGDSSVIHCLSSQHNNPYLTEILPRLTTTLLTILFVNPVLSSSNRYIVKKTLMGILLDQNVTQMIRHIDAFS